MDEQTSVQQLRQQVQTFVDQRQWNRYHTPRNLVMALVVEVAELMELFQWRTDQEAARIMEQPQVAEAVQDELADVLCYVLALANTLSIDLSTALKNKMAKNQAKYPVEQYRGRWENKP